MAAPPLRTEISDTYPNPSNATARIGFGKLWDYVTGLLGSTGDAEDMLLGLGVSAAPGALNTLASVPSAAASTTFTASQIIVAESAGGRVYRLDSFSETIDLSTTGAGGMDTGSAPTSGYVGVYAIYNPSTDTSALLAVNATASAAPEIYAGANMPSGYTASALISVWPTDGSGQFVAANQRERSVGIVPAVALEHSTVSASLTAASIASTVPKNAKAITGSMAFLSSAGPSGMIFAIAADANGSFEQQTSGVSTNTFPQYGNFRMNLLNEQTIYYRTTNGAGTPTYTVVVSSYEI